MSLLRAALGTRLPAASRGERVHSPFKKLQAVDGIEEPSVHLRNQRPDLLARMIGESRGLFKPDNSSIQRLISVVQAVVVIRVVPSAAIDFLAVHDLNDTRISATLCP